MTRPALRPMRVLPVLEPRRDALEKCVFCPKLCRSACPVSNAEPRETITPWGKMSAAWMAAHGDVPIEQLARRPGLGVHRLPRVPRVVRSPQRRRRRAPRRARRAGPDGDGAPRSAPRGRALRRFTRARTRAGARDARGSHPARARRRRPTRSSWVAAICAPRSARRATPSTPRRRSSGGPVALVEACCGLPLLLAGDALGFAQQARDVARSLARHERVWVVDAGCALALRSRYAEAGVPLRPTVETLVEAAARDLAMLGPSRADAVSGTSPSAGTTPVSSGAGSASTTRRASS